MKHSLAKKGQSSSARRKIVFWPRKLQHHTVQTIIVDTPSLVDIRHIAIETYPFGTTHEQLLSAAAHAVVKTKSIHLEQLGSLLMQPTTAPAAIYTSPLIGSAWNHGERYLLYWLGAPDAVLQRCDLTDNEREQALIQSRALGARGTLVYCVATSSQPHTKTTDITNIAPRDLTLLGFITSQLRLHPGTLQAAQFCRQRNIRLIYLSSHSELTTSTVAHLAKLLSPTKQPALYNLKTHTSTSADCFPQVSSALRQRFIDQFDPRTTLVADDTLASVAATITIR